MINSPKHVFLLQLQVLKVSSTQFLTFEYRKHFDHNRRSQKGLFLKLERTFQTRCVCCAARSHVLLNKFIPRKVMRLTYVMHAAGVNGPVNFSLFI